jgi:peroxiredoxin
MLEENLRILQGLVGCKAPTFAVETLDGREFSMEKLHGKIVVLSFWYTTCAPCVYELPGLNKLVEEFAGKDVFFLAIARNERDEVMRFNVKHEYAYVHALSSEALQKQFCLMGGWPMNMVIDGEGILRFVKSGGPGPPDGNPLQPYLEMKPVIEKYLKP